MHKPCFKCGEVKPLSDFYRHPQMKDGHVNKCKECNKKDVKENRAARRSQYSAYERRRYAERGHRYTVDPVQYQREWRSQNREMSVAQRQKRRAFLLNAVGSYTAKEFIALCVKYNNKCLACSAADVILTVDHVVPLSKGGTNSIDNIQPLCKSCNSSKHTKHVDYRY